MKKLFQSQWNVALFFFLEYSLPPRTTRPISSQVTFKMKTTINLSIGEYNLSLIKTIFDCLKHKNVQSIWQKGIIFVCHTLKWFAQLVRTRTMNPLAVLIIRVRVQPVPECSILAYSMRMRIAQAKVAPKCRLQYALWPQGVQVVI